MSTETFLTLMIPLVLIGYFLMPLWDIYKLDGTKPFKFGMDDNWRIKRRNDYIFCYVRMVCGIVILSLIWWRYL